MWHEPCVAEQRMHLGDRIFGVHVCDWPHGEPRHAGDRVLPGDGVINLPPLLSAIERSGYHDVFCLEIVSVDQLEDSLWRQDPADVICRRREGFDTAWSQRTCD